MAMEEERTNGETLLWVQSFKGYGQVTFNSAKSFFALWSPQTVEIVEGKVFDGTQKDKTRYSCKAHVRVRWYR